MPRRQREHENPVGKRPVLFTAVVLGAGVWLLAVSVAAVLPVPYSITIDGGAPYFFPKAATVSAHVPIRWYNTTGTSHTITHEDCETSQSCLFDSGVVPPAGSYELPGLPPGLYRYYCRLHPIMRGILTVAESAVPSSAS